MSLVGAVEIIAGNSYSFESEQFEYYEVVGNQSNLEGMDITWEDGNTTISFDVNYKPDNFTIIFFNQETEVIVEHHYSSGGSGGTRTIYKNVTEYKDKIIYKDKVVEMETDTPPPITPPPKEVLKEYSLKTKVISVLIFLIICAGAIISEFIEREEEEWKKIWN